MPVSVQLFLMLWTPASLAMIGLGTFLGIVVGAIPGLTGAMLIALSLPLTFAMDPQLALTLLVSMYVGAVSGGMITGTLLRMPGTPASIMTTLDGYPMAESGRPGRALGLGISASLIGGLISWFFLVVLARPIAHWSATFGPFEFFSLVFMALVMIASVGGKSVTASLFSGSLGILVAMPGIAASSGKPRLTFGIESLNDGFKLLPVLIGLFAVNQVLQEIGVTQRANATLALGKDRVFLSWADWKQQFGNMLRSSLVGTWIGILPGIGANIGSVSAYTLARSFSRQPEAFGTGCDEGIVASEAANNATVGGALIPLIAIGIPGSVIDAILLGALVVHGLQPGPRLFSDNPEMVHTIIGAYLIANVVMAALMFACLRVIIRVVEIPRYYLAPVVLTFCVIGSYSLSYRIFDVWVMLGFGVLGYLLERTRIPLAPFVIGFVLGPIAEENLSAGLMASGGSFLPLVTRPISALFLLLSAALLLVPRIARPRHEKPS